MIMSDQWLWENGPDIIQPFHMNQVSKGVISYGVSSYGYDFRIADEFKIFVNTGMAIIDPLDFDENAYIEFQGDVCVIPPNSYILGRSVEYFRMPRGVLGLCVGKSTYARCGIAVNMTPLEPMWEGYLTLEIANQTSLPAKVYANQGISQLLFLKGNEPCRISYADRKGKYQGQQGVVPARVNLPSAGRDS